MKTFLKTKDAHILTYENEPVFLKGVNLGGWLMMEAYILYAPNYPEQKFRNNFINKLGKKAMMDFDRLFRQHFIQEKDITNIANHGFNCIRVPFHYRLIEKSPYRYDKDGIGILDQVLSWAQKYKIWVILDLHAAMGSQNHDWHSDSNGEAMLWRNHNLQKRVFALWEMLADRYKNADYLAGYDLLNESVLKKTKLLNRFYQQLIKIIRRADKKHILFIEGNNWAMDIDCLDEFAEDNYVLSIHHYLPLEFTFNFIPGLHYTIKGKRGVWNKSDSKKYLCAKKRIAERRKVPIYVGEFGINYRDAWYGEVEYLKDTLDIFKELGFHWTYWTYKAVKNFCFPDGIYSYCENPAWVNRQGPLTGWDTYADLWEKDKKSMCFSWQTQNFRLNQPVLKALKNGV